MKLLLGALFSISLLFTIPALAEKPDMAAKGKEVKKEAKKMAKEVQDEATDMVEEVSDEAQDMIDPPDNAAEEAIEEADEMLEEAVETGEEAIEESTETVMKKGKGLQKNMDKGSDTGKQKREENIPWWDFWSE